VVAPPTPRARTRWARRARRSARGPRRGGGRSPCTARRASSPRPWRRGAGSSPPPAPRRSAPPSPRPGGGGGVGARPGGRAAAGLRDGVVLIDLAARGHVLDLQRGWDVCRREADACLLSDGTLPREAQRLFAPATLLAVPPAPPDALVARARLLVVGRRAGEALRAGVDALREARLRAAAEAKARRARIPPLEAPDPAAFASARPRPPSAA